MDGVAGYWSIRDVSIRGVTFTSISYFVMRGNRVYSIICTANAKDFSDFEATFDEVGTSFRFLS